MHSKRKHHVKQKRKNVRWKMYKDQRVAKKKSFYAPLYIILKIIRTSGFELKSPLNKINRNSKNRFWNIEIK